MNDATLTELWRQIRRTARPGARVILPHRRRRAVAARPRADDVLFRLSLRASRRGASGSATAPRSTARSIYGFAHERGSRRSARGRWTGCTGATPYLRSHRKFYLLGRDELIAGLKPAPAPIA